MVRDVFGISDEETAIKIYELVYASPAVQVTWDRLAWRVVLVGWRLEEAYCVSGVGVRSRNLDYGQTWRVAIEISCKVRRWLEVACCCTRGDDCY